MLRDNDIMEELNYAYVHAVAAAAGFACDRPAKDRDSMDCIITAHGQISLESIFHSPVLGLQLKATKMAQPTGPRFSYNLKIKNYNDLRVERTYPTLLVVYAMPHDKEQWLTHSRDNLVSRHCAYWCDLTHAPSVTNGTTRSVYIPSSNHFSIEALKEIMYKASRFERMGNDFQPSV